MFPILAALFIIVPAVELKILWEIGGRIGIGQTLAIIILTGIFGAHLARAQGLKVINDINSDLAGGKLPGDNLISGALVLAGGVLLVTPGILTDMVGLLLMLPPVRRFAGKILKKRFAKKINISTFTAGQPPFTRTTEDEVREAEAKIIDDTE